MNELIITTQKNGKFYIKSDFYLNIDEIIFFDCKLKKQILSVPGRHSTYKVNRLNTLYNITQEGEEEAKAIILNNKPIRKLKENLAEKNNFYIAQKEKHYSYDEYKIILYININIEKIEIFEGEEYKKEFQDGHFQVYKNFNFKNLFIEFKNLEHIFFTNEEIEKMTYNDFRKYEIKKIDEEIRKEKEHEGIKPFQRYIKRLKELKNEGYSHIGFTYVEKEAEVIQQSIYNGSYDTKERQQRSKNITYLKNIIYNERKIKELFNKFNINIDIVNFEEN